MGCNPMHVVAESPHTCFEHALVPIAATKKAALAIGMTLLLVRPIHCMC